MTNSLSNSSANLDACPVDLPFDCMHIKICRARRGLPYKKLYHLGTFIGLLQRVHLPRRSITFALRQLLLLLRHGK